MNERALDLRISVTPSGLWAVECPQDPGLSIAIPQRGRKLSDVLRDTAEAMDALAVARRELGQLADKEGGE